MRNNTYSPLKYSMNLELVYRLNATGPVKHLKIFVDDAETS